MNGVGHRAITAAAFDFLTEIEGNPPSLQRFLGWKNQVAEAAAHADYLADLEFVNVEGLWRDDPHETDGVFPRPFKDKASTTALGFDLCAFNHFIDIRKGPGKFDDYDGYSYERGSGHVDQYQTGLDWVEHDRGGDLGTLAGILDKILAIPGALGGPDTGWKIDHIKNWWLNDEYVHAPGLPYYHACSPSIKNYSFFADKAAYASLEAECRARFPLAESIGCPGWGVPYSVFMPVDNLARYWYGAYLDKPHDPTKLGPVMHAIQEAAVPHHASGCLGNWHSRYEAQTGANTADWIVAEGQTVRGLIAGWNWQDPCPPSHLNPEDWSRRPARNWRIDQLVTWVALHAYAAYDQVYHGFRDGWQGVDDASGSNLTGIATAMSVHVLRNAGPLYAPLKPDPCSKEASRLKGARAALSIANNWLKKKLSEELREEWQLKQKEAQRDVKAAEQALAKCRAEH